MLISSLSDPADCNYLFRLSRLDVGRFAFDWTRRPVRSHGSCLCVVRLLPRQTLKGIFQRSHWHLDQATRRPIEIDDQHDDGSDHQGHDQ